MMLYFWIGLLSGEFCYLNVERVYSNKIKERIGGGMVGMF